MVPISASLGPLGGAVFLNEFVPKGEDSIEQIKWVFTVSIYFDFQRPVKTRLYGYEFNAGGVVGDWAGDEDSFYIWPARLRVRDASVFCGVRYDIANRKVGTLPTHLVLELS